MNTSGDIKNVDFSAVELWLKGEGNEYEMNIDEVIKAAWDVLSKSVIPNPKISVKLDEGVIVLFDVIDILAWSYAQDTMATIRLTKPIKPTGEHAIK